MYAPQMVQTDKLGITLTAEQKIQHLLERLDLKDTIMQAYGHPDSYKFFSEDDYIETETGDFYT